MVAGVKKTLRRRPASRGQDGRRRVVSCSGRSEKVDAEQMRISKMNLKNSGNVHLVSHVHDVQITRESPNYRIG